MSDSSRAGARPSRQARRAGGAPSGRRAPAQAAVEAEPCLDRVRDVLLSIVRGDGRDLTARQLSAFLVVYSQDTVHSVSSLAEIMHISRPGVTRVMDRLVRFELLAREEDPRDRRRVLARRTARGLALHRDLVATARAASAR